MPNGDEHKNQLLQAAAVLVRWRNSEEGAVESAQLLWDIIERREKERAARAQAQSQQAEGQSAQGQSGQTQDAKMGAAGKAQDASAKEPEKKF